MWRNIVDSSRGVVWEAFGVLKGSFKGMRGVWWQGRVRVKQLIYAKFMYVNIQEESEINKLLYRLKRR